MTDRSLEVPDKKRETEGQRDRDREEAAIPVVMMVARGLWGDSRFAHVGCPNAGKRIREPVP